MGASDFVAEAAYTYDDMPPGETDYEMRHFSIAHDEAQILPLLRQALALNPDLRIIASPWSPPAWMKTNGSLIGGELIDDPRIYRAYADYFVEFLLAYERAGVPVYAVTTQNEPQNRNPSGYPGMYMSAGQQARFIAELGPALLCAGLDTKILAYDHNWSMHPGDIESTPPGETPETEYPSLVLATTRPRRGSTASPITATSAIRRGRRSCTAPSTTSTSTSPSAPGRTARPIRRRRSSPTRSSGTRATSSSASRRNWSRTVVNWNLALDPSGGPHVGGCDTCTGVVTVGPGQTVTNNAEYYTLGHLARFVRPGAVRVASTSFGTTGWNGQIMDVAFRNPDGSTALVVHNENDEPRTFAVAAGAYSFEYTLPGGALATFVWPRSRALDDPLDQLEPARMTATASPAGPTDPCCTGDVAAGAVDDDATTRWASGAPQAPGQYVQVDLGRRERIARVVLDTGAGTGDFPRGYALHLSDDGVTWSDPVATGAGTGQLTAIDISPRRARHIRIVATAAADSWWSVADLRVYRP